MLQLITTALAAFFAQSVEPAAASPAIPPPAALAPYIREGRLDPGDFGWMRGRFVGASEAERQAFREVQAWAGRCLDDARAETMRQLATAGFPDAPAIDIGGGPALCVQALAMPPLPNDTTVEAFNRAVLEARPVADGFLTGVRLAETVTRARSPALADRIAARTVTEQILRHAVGWGEGGMADAPALSPLGRAILQARITAALVEVDHANTAWLKGVVGEAGWPKITEVGESGSAAAWLLVQHADDDPLFQLQALRLMEPLLASREVSRGNHAYLYDRVMLKLSGKQRYATQVTCSAGKRIPRPLEDEAAVPSLRQAAGLEPVDEYLARMDKIFAPCPPSSGRLAPTPR